MSCEMSSARCNWDSSTLPAECIPSCSLIDDGKCGDTTDCCGHDDPESSIICRHHLCCIANGGRGCTGDAQCCGESTCVESVCVAGNMHISVHIHLYGFIRNTYINLQKKHAVILNLEVVWMMMIAVMI